MRTRRAITAIASGLTVFLVVSVPVMELLVSEFLGSIRLPIGLVAGDAIAGVSRRDEFSDALRAGINQPIQASVSSHPIEQPFP